MAAEKIFVSPGVFTSEKDLTFISQSVGVTTLGVVGETLKGPAFEPIFISNYEEFTALFGGLSPEKFTPNNIPKYELPYIAKSYLTESNQLFVTRILGLTGYIPGGAWMITADANYDPSTYATGGTCAAGCSWTADFNGSTYTNFAGAGSTSVQFLYNADLLDNGNVYTSTATDIPGVTDTYPEGIMFTKISDIAGFSGVSSNIVQTSVNVTALTGTVSGTVYTYVADAYTNYEGMVLAMLRSRGDVSSDTLTYRTTTGSSGVVINVTDTTNPLAAFELSATSNTTGVVYKYDVSLDSTANNYITKVLGTTHFDRDRLIFVEEIYPTMIDDLIENGYILGVNTSLVYTTNFNNYQQEYQTPETPWIVSELRGNVVEQMFKFITISDGASANKEIKISIINIKPDTKQFDVIVRDFYDTDARPSIIESFPKCDMDPESSNYIARRIGTADGEFTLKSRYIMAVVNEDASTDSFPAGFDGYIVRNYPTNSVAPYLVYNKSYDPVNEQIRKVYLGLSDTIGIDQNMFNWKGYTNGNSPAQWTATTKGFHMDSGATVAGDFEVGSYEFRSTSGIANTDYENLNSRKFTLAPYLGFDGWNEFRRERTNTDRYKVGRAGFTAGAGTSEFELTSATEGTSDYYAYLNGIQTFRNPESVNINVFATANINWSDNNELVQSAIEMVEEERADSLYVVNAPEGADYDGVQLTGLGFNSATVSSVDGIISLLDAADIDSNYTTTFWPWIQERDTENNVNIWLPPTLEVVRNIALTDNIAFPWYASAGYTRGLTNALQARAKLTESARDTLYEGRINPMATFSDQGVIIWGNKNLQVADSALDRNNVRRLLLQTRKLISAVAVRLLFEQNDQIVRNQFLALVNPILDNIRRERGLFDFRVVVSNDPEEIDRNELRGKIFLKPIPTLEYIIIEFNVTKTGASFDNI